MVKQPGGSGDSKHIEGVAQCFRDILNAVQGADGGQDMGGIGALLATCFEQPFVSQEVNDGVKEQSFGIVGKQAVTKFTQDREIKARIIQRQSKGILPGDAVTDIVGGLTIADAFDELEDGDQGKTDGGESRTAIVGEEMSELVVLVDHAEVVTEVEIQIAFGKGGMRDTMCLVRDGKIIERGIQTHDNLLGCADVGQ
jgi:hypothetical protein